MDTADDSPRHPIGTRFYLRAVSGSRFHDRAIIATVVGIGPHDCVQSCAYTIEYTSITGATVREYGIGHATIARGIEKLRESF